MYRIEQSTKTGKVALKRGDGSDDDVIVSVHDTHREAIVELIGMRNEEAKRLQRLLDLATECQAECDEMSHSIAKLLAAEPARLRALHG